MNKIKLTPLAISDLTLKYARRLEGNKITHYVVPMVKIMVGVDPQKEVENFILKNEPDAEIQFLKPMNSYSPDSSTAASSEPITSSPPLLVNDYPNLLANEPEIKAALKKVKVNSTLYVTFARNPNSKGLAIKFSILNKFVSFWNRAASSVNRLISALLKNDPEHKYPITDDRYDISKLVDKNKSFLPMMDYPPSNEIIRSVNPCQFLSVAYEDGDEAIAEKAILDDLRFFQKRGTILGHLAMPSTIPLADKIGSGKAYSALFCYIFVDINKASGHDDGARNPKWATEFPELRTLTPEGGIAILPELDLNSRYDITVVNVSEGSSDEALKAYHQSYLDSLAAVEKAANATQKKIDAASKA